jgi:hypothetical protein
MKTVKINVFSFNELSKEAKQTAIENYRNNNTEIFWTDENRESMEKFAEVFPIEVTNWSYGGRGEGVSFHFTAHGDIEELKGQRLATYIWNNYRGEIYSRKYYGDANVKHCIKHKRIECIDHKNGNFTNAYYSAITIETGNCPLTGYYMDNEILDPIWKFLDKPSESVSFKDLLEVCFDSWIEACNNDIEEQNSDEYISDNIEANGYEFTEDGEQF